MRITKLTLTNFRNYAHCEFAPEGGINLIVGENAQGKTNLLEAVFFCCFGRSHRTSREKDLIAYDEAFARIRLRACAPKRRTTCACACPARKGERSTSTARRSPASGS